MNPFDYVNDINYNKVDIITNSDNPELAEKLYQPYLVNRALSQFPDTVRVVNEMNIHHSLDKKLQFDFLINIIRKKKRFTKWAKKIDDENIELVMLHYGYSYEKAKQVLPLLSDDQIITIKKKRFEGGLKCLVLEKSLKV